MTNSFPVCVLRALLSWGACRIIMSNPQTSVIIPSYNYGRFLRESIESVLHQEPGDLEILVVDDGSTDETPSVLAAISDPRLRAFRTNRSGVAGARNYALERVRGEFIAFQDADDRWRPGKLSRQLDLMMAEPSVGVIFTDFIRFTPTKILTNQFTFHPELASTPTRQAASGSGRVLLGDSFLNLLAMGEFPILPSSLLCRRSSIGNIRFDPRLRISEDLLFAMRIYERTTAAFIPEVLLEVRRHGDNSSNDIVEMIWAKIEALQILGAECSPAHRKPVHARIGRCLTSLGYRHFWDKRPLAAAGAYGRALAYPGRRLHALSRLVACPLSLFVGGRNATYPGG